MHYCDGIVIADKENVYWAKHEGLGKKLSIMTVPEGISILKKMIVVAGNKLEIMPAGRITIGNLDEIHKSIGACAYHGRQIVGEY